MCALLLQLRGGLCGKGACTPQGLKGHRFQEDDFIHLPHDKALNLPRARKHPYTDARWPTAVLPRKPTGLSQPTHCQENFSQRLEGNGSPDPGKLGTGLAPQGAEWGERLRFLGLRRGVTSLLRFSGFQGMSCSSQRKGLDA